MFTTEITSETIPSDNPIHQRLFKAYILAQPYIHGKILEVGCGEGRGIKLLNPLAESYTALDKIAMVVEKLQTQFPQSTFIRANIPPFSDLQDNAFDVVISFQVIEHIKDDQFFLEEVYRVLKPGGKGLITTPNIKKSLTRNPWHQREYTAEQLLDLASGIFKKVDVKGITGNQKVWQYYEMNKRSVEKITRFDIFNLQHRLPAALLRMPYELLNRLNRNKLQSSNDQLVTDIQHEDYLLSEQADQSLDLFLIVEK